MRQALGKLIAVGLAVCLTVGCGKKDIDKVSEGQDCLDTATAATALNCLEKIDGLDSAAANIVRCSIYFVDQGFADPARLSSVAQQITATSTPGSSSIAALTVMGFTSSKYNMATNDTLSATTLSSCLTSQSGGLIYLASMARIATATLKDAGFNSLTGTAPTATDMQNAICTGSPSPTTKSAMGSAALAAYNKNCLGKDISKDVMCKQYQEAIGSQTDPAAVGAALITTVCN